MSSIGIDTRQNILEASRLLIQERGGAYVSLADIGRRAGVSRQAVYLHFSSRFQLLEQLAAYVDEVEGVDAQIERVLGAERPAELLDGIVQLHATHRTKVAAVAAALDRAILEEPSLRQVWRTKLEGRRNLATDAVRRIKAAGAISPRWTDDEAIDLLTSLTSFRTWRELTEDCRWSPERYQRTISRALRETLLIPEAVALASESAGNVG